MEHGPEQKKLGEAAFNVKNAIIKNILPLVDSGKVDGDFLRDTFGLPIDKDGYVTVSESTLKSLQGLIDAGLNKYLADDEDHPNQEDVLSGINAVKDVLHDNGL